MLCYDLSINYYQQLQEAYCLEFVVYSFKINFYINLWWTVITFESNNHNIFSLFQMFHMKRPTNNSGKLADHNNYDFHEEM